MYFEDFDIIQFLESRDIKYKTSGKNVSSGWIEINCCFCQDPSFHLGINLDSNLYNCWVCGEKGSATKLIKEIDQCSWATASLTVEEFSQDILAKPEKKPKLIISNKKIVWPKHTQEGLSSLHRKYLEGRNFDPDLLTDKYQLKSTSNLGGWKFRIIIPVILDNRIVSFTSRDVTNKTELAYRHLPDSKSIVPIKDTLYNFDSVDGSAILVEGIMDVWRIGDGAVASYGTQLTKEQIVILSNLKTLFIMFDCDATDKAGKLADQLATNVDHVEVIEMSEGDPAEMTVEDVRNLRVELGF